MHQLLLLVKAFEQKISALMLSSYVSGTIIDVSSNEIIPEDATPPVNGSKKKSFYATVLKGKSNNSAFQGWLTCKEKSISFKLQK